MSKPIIHDKLICPRCAGSGVDLIPSYNGVDVICNKCGTRTPIKKLRCKVEPSHAVPTIKRTPLGGYFRGMDMNQHEKEALDEHLKSLRGRYADLNTPGLYTRKFSNYVKDGSYKKHADEMGAVKL